jgi:hypothetical protein
MSLARCYGLPATLDAAGNALGLTTVKDRACKALIKAHCTPPARPPGQTLYDYCLQDVRAEKAIADALPPHPERDYWLAHQAINARGVALDTGAVADVVALLPHANTDMAARMRGVTGGAVESPTQVARLASWTRMPSVDAASIRAALDDPATPPVVAEALRIRQQYASTSVTKALAMQDSMHAGRLRESYAHHGARTGRATAHGAQPANLPRGGPPV